MVKDTEEDGEVQALLLKPSNHRTEILAWACRRAKKGLVEVHFHDLRNYAVNNLNQYTSAGSVTFSYDASGNLTASGRHA